jgi:hypothetical protein
MSNNAYIVINNGTPFEGKLNFTADGAKLLYSTQDGTFAVTASEKELKVRFVGEKVAYTFLLDSVNPSALIVEAGGNRLSPAEVKLDFYKFKKSENGFFLTAKYLVEENEQSLTLSASVNE